MGKVGTGAVVQQLQMLWDAGALGSVDDGALLEQYLLRDGTAEGAFAALVERHGPMVLRVCRDVLRDPHDAKDAAQATFLILARKASSIRRHTALASWLFGTARRVASLAKRDAARRRRHERQWAEAVATARQSQSASEDQDRCWPELHEELERLPGRYRTAIVLCDLEGLSHEQASSRLGCPLRTLQTRLYRGRERLRLRLVRRGLTLATALVGTSHANGAFITVPPTWRIATVQAAVQVVGGPGAWARVGGVSAEVIRMARTGLNEMKMSMIKIGATVGLLVGAAGTVAWSQMSDGVDGKSKRPGTTRTSKPTDDPAKSGALERRLTTPFDRTYILVDGEDLKAFKSPARDLRVEHDRASSRDQGSGGFQNENTDIYFRWRDGARSFLSSVGGDKGIELRSALLPILGMQAQEAEGDVELLKTSIRADFIIRDGVSTEKLVPQFAAILRKDFSLPIKLALRTESRKVIVVRGRYQFKSDKARDRAVQARSKADRIEVYARAIRRIGDHTHYLFTTGFDLATFLSDLAKHAGRQFVNEVEVPPEGYFEWHISDYSYPVAISEEDLDLTLEHLAAQTGLTYKREVRKVRVLRVERDQ
jgi:RNA polymerase sigma factor (sigma-70 family)